jgi:hypothetical protein
MARAATQRRPESPYDGDRRDTTPRSEGKSKRRLFHATVLVTRVEQWSVEAEDADEALALLQSGGGQRSQIGECVHFEVETLGE